MEANEVPDRIVQSIAFRPDGVVEISYSEGTDMSENIAIVKSLMFDATLVPMQVQSLLEETNDLIDVAIDKLRNPPLTRPSGLTR